MSIRKNDGETSGISSTETKDFDGDSIETVTGLDSGLSEYMYYDYLHSLRFVTDGTGALKAAYDYYPYGTPVYSLTNSDTDADPTFASHEQDEESGNYYAKQRYYDPGTGRFNRLDPVKDNLNWYAYCGGDPVNSYDPWGLAAENPDGNDTLLQVDEQPTAPDDVGNDDQEDDPRNGSEGTDSKNPYEKAREAAQSAVNKAEAEAEENGKKLNWFQKLQIYNQAYRESLYNQLLDIIEFEGNPTQEELEKFKESILYILLTPRGQQLIGNIISGFKQKGWILTIRFIVTREGYDNMYKNGYSYALFQNTQHVLKWDPNAGAKGKGGFMSPALFLAHELGHAEQEVLGITDELKDLYKQLSDANKVNDTKTANKISNKILIFFQHLENLNVRFTDSVIGRQLNELGIKEFGRTYYYDVTEYINYSSFYDNIDYLIYYTPHYNDYGLELTAG